jgi:sulfate adenylyltransferase (ADP) / ATP adenylyltransferase
LTSLPYANHIIRFPSTFSSSPPSQLTQTITQAFLSLLDLTISTIRHDPEYPAGKPSYNVLITLEHMHLIPRRLESATLEWETKNTSGGPQPLSVNSLAFAGMLMTRSEEELEAVKREGVGKILRSVGLKSVHDLQVAGTYFDDGEES